MIRPMTLVVGLLCTAVFEAMRQNGTDPLRKQHNRLPDSIGETV